MIQKHPVYFKNEQFCTDMIELWYPLPEASLFLAERTILPSLLMKTSAAFPDEKQFHLEVLRHLIDSMSISVETIGTQLFYCVSLRVPNQTILPELKLLDCLSFFLDTLFHPDLVEGNFRRFEQEKRRLKAQIQRAMKEKDFYAEKRVLEHVDPDGFLCQKLTFHPEKLEDLTDVQVMDFYQKIFQEQVPFLFLFGSEALSSLLPVLEQRFDFESHPPQIIFDCNQFLKPMPLEMIEDSKPYQESILTIVYKVRDMNEEDRLLLMVLNRILSSSSSPLLMNELRDREKLVYSVYSRSYSHFAFLNITCEIERNSKEQALSHIRSLMEELSTSPSLEEGLKAVQEQNQISLLRKLDQKYAIFNDLIDDYFGVELPLEEEGARIEEMKVEDLRALLGRLTLDFVYFLKGDLDETI